MKKKLLFVIETLECAGAEKSLISLLQLLDYDQYEVDLQLISYGGELEELIPKEVNLLPPLPYMIFIKRPIYTQFQTLIDKEKRKYLSARIHFSKEIRKGNPKNVQKARIFWRGASKVIQPLQKTYDTAIAYSQGIPTFFVAEKVKAANKCGWVNVSYTLNTEEKEFQKKFYKEFSHVIAVSDKTKEIFLENKVINPEKVKVIYDITDPQTVNKMAESREGYSDAFSGIRILTVGRLAKQKGYDIALSACWYLKNKGYSFKWYVLGKGPLEDEIRKEISRLGLEDVFILLGVESNPYPYIKQADLYVQTSRFEGFGIALAEARLLNIPIVTTNFDAVHSQMVHEKNGIITDINGQAVAEGIERVLNDSKLRQSIIDNLAQEKKGNLEEANKVMEILT